MRAGGETCAQTHSTTHSHLRNESLENFFPLTPPRVLSFLPPPPPIAALPVFHALQYGTGRAQARSRHGVIVVTLKSWCLLQTRQGEREGKEGGGKAGGGERGEAEGKGSVLSKQRQ